MELEALVLDVGKAIKAIDSRRPQAKKPNDNTRTYVHRESGDPPSGVGDLFGLEQLLRIGAPFVVPCDRHDLGTLTSLKPPATVYLYETVPGGIGVAEKALEVWPTVIETAIGIAERCPCKHGCPSCLVPPRLPAGFEEPKKEPAITIARRFLDIASSSARERFDPETHAWVPLSQEST